MKKYLLPLGIAALLLSGCSNESTESEPAAKDASASSTPTAATKDAPASSMPTADAAEPPVDVLGPGSYTFESVDGTKGTLQIPDATPADLEELCPAPCVDPVTYLTGTIDNREGYEPFSVDSVKVFDAAGEVYSFEPVADYILNAAGSGSRTTPGYQKYRELAGRFPEIVSVGERLDIVMVGLKLPAEIASVSVVHEYDEMEASPAG